MRTPSPPSLEHEHRFVLARKAAEAFISLVAPRLVLDVYDADRPNPYTRTTYLDTPDLELFRSCDQPLSRRLRIREYAAVASLAEDPVLTGICNLELKESAGAARTKARLACRPELLAAVGPDGGTLCAAVLDELDRIPEFAPVRQQLAAGLLALRMTTWYRRASLSNEGGRIRVTLDEGIAYCRPVRAGPAGATAEPDEVIEYGPGRVLEVKFSGEAPGWLKEAMSGLTETTCFSKFRLGMWSAQRAGATPRHMTIPIDIPSPVQLVKRR